MRKVKVLAFVLAALMVVAAFAGCGTKEIKADVTTLDERVTALEALLKQVNDTVNGGATKDDITEILDAITANKAEAAAGDKTLADAIAKITADQATANAALKADLEKLVDAAKKDQAAGDTALQVAIEKLNNSIDATNKALADAIKDLEGDLAAGDKATLDAVKELLDDQNKDIADALEDLKESIEKNKEEAGVNASVQAKASAYVSNLTTAKTTYDFEEAHYTASDFAAIEKAIANGITAIQAATTVEAVDAAYAAVVAELAKYERVDVALYNAYKALMNKINLDSKDAIKAYGLQVSAAKEHYGTDATSVLNSYEYASNKYAKLIDAAQEFTNAFNWLNDVLIYRIQNVVAAVNAIGRVQFRNLDKPGEDDDVARNVEAVVAAKALFDKNDTTNKVYGVKTIITDTNASRTDERKYGQYLDDALVNLVTNKDTLTAHVNTVNALTKAEALLDTYASLNNAGSYNNVFSDYLNVAAAKRNWFNAESKFNAVNKRINAWLADNPAVDAQNEEAILNYYLASKNVTYAEYREDEAQMKLFLAKYNTFKSEFVPRIKAANKFTEVSTENVQTYVELVKDIKEWLVVIPDDDDADELPELVIEAYDVANSQYEQMLKSAFGKDSYKKTFAFEETEVVAPFFANTVAKAEKVADYINEVKIAPLAASSTELSIEKFKALEGYVEELDENDNPTGIYSIPTPAADAGDDAAYLTRIAALFDGDNVVSTVNIAQFKHAFTRTVVEADSVYSYDLSYLLDLDALEAAQNATEARIAEVEVLTAKINAALKAIKLDLAAASEAKTGVKVKIDELSGTEYNALLNTVNLDNKTSVEALKADYTSLIAKGFKHSSTRKWTAVTDAAGNVVPGKFYNKQLLDTTTVHEITGFVNVVDELKAMANNLVSYLGKVAAAHKFKAFSVDNCDLYVAVTSNSKSSVTYTDATTGKEKTDTTRKWGYLKNDKELGTRWFKISNISKTDSTTNNSKADSQPRVSGSSSDYYVLSNGLSQFAAVELAWNAYYQFLADNQYSDYAAVESAMETNGLVDLRFIAIKALAYNAIQSKDASKATAWQPSFGDYQTQEDIQLSAIKSATTLEAVADILYGFYEMTGSAYDAIDFAGVDYFHTDGTLHVESEKYPCDHEDHDTVNA